MKEEIVQKLKEYDFDKDNYIGILSLLETNEDYKKMLEYLNDINTSKTRNDIFEYAFKITNTEFDEFIVE